MKNESTNVFKALLGIKDDKQAASLVDDTTEVLPVHDLSAELKALEALDAEAQEEDPAGYAADKLEQFNLTRGAKTLLDRAMDNISRNNGASIVDEDAKLDIQLRAELVSASGNDLSVLIESLTEETPFAEQGGVLYSMLFNILKGATFEANLDYRRFLDPSADFELVGYMKPITARNENGEDYRDQNGEFAVDRREETSPLEGLSGFATRVEVMLEQARELYGHDVQCVEDVIPGALSDLRYYFQLICESYGWDHERGMPFLFVTELDGGFTPIHDPMQALDTQELRRQAARAKKRTKTNDRMQAAAARARKALSAAGKRAG